MAAPSLTYTLTNGSTADATQVQQNFSDLLNGITDGTKDLSISALTCAGTATLNGHVNLGNSSADDLTITASLASTLPIKTTNTYDIGTSTIGLRALYLGANSQTVNIKGSSSMSATWTMTLPVNAGTNNYVLATNGSGVTSWTTISNANVDSAAAISGAKLNISSTDLGTSPTTGTNIARSGRYTPTLGGSTNVAASSISANSMIWGQQGNTITCSGYFTIQATAATPTGTAFTLTLPITPASNFSNAYEASGVTSTVTSTNSEYSVGIVYATTSAKTVTVEYVARNTSAGRVMTYFFQYELN